MKISDFKSIYESDVLRPEIPGTDLHINPADLVGIGRPEDVKKLYGMLESRLNG